MRESVTNNISLYAERESDLPQARIRELHQRASQEIRVALQPFGYYRPVIHATLEESPSNRGDTDDTDNTGSVSDQRDSTGTAAWTARYVVELGPPLQVRHSDMIVIGEGQQDPAFISLVERFPLRSGAPLNHAVYEDTKNRLQALALERGYFEARLTRHQIYLDLDNYYADVALTMDTGPRYRFGEITIEQTVLDPELLNGYIRISPGDPYTTTALIDAQNALTSSDYFSSIDVTADPANAQQRAVPVNIRLVAQKKNRYTAGVGYGTDTGPRIQAGWQRRYINNAGHHARTDIRQSDIERSINATYFIPFRNPRTDQYAISAGYNEDDTLTAFSKIRRYGVSRTTARGRLLETLSLTHQNESFIIGSENSTSSLLLPGVAWTHVLSDNPIYTRIGTRLFLEVRGASDNLGSDTNLLQARAQAKFILPLSSFGRFIVRGELGATAIDEFATLPASLRFFAGGDASVRGYAYNTLGPTDTAGDVVGGRGLIAGSVEYEQSLVGNWAAAAFYDTGNAVNDFNEPLRKSAGVGLRWRSPVGQIRLDVAQPIDDPEHSWRVHLNLGPDL